MDEHKAVPFRFSVDKKMHSTIETLVRFLSAHDSKRMTRQNFITTAIKEKLQKKNMEEMSSLMKDRFFFVKLDSHINDEVSSIVETVRKYRTSYSKKQWVVEAIAEKIEEEEKKMKNTLIS